MPDLEMPAATIPGWIPTLNHNGFMTLKLDDYSQAFVDYSATAPGPVLDIGAAYGVASLAALARGATVVANDTDARHLEILVKRAPADQQARLTTVVGEVQSGLRFPERHFAAILACRVLHLLWPEEVEMALANIARWLLPGGKVFTVSETPYNHVTSAFIPVYERRKAAGENWPGLLPNVLHYAPLNMQGSGAYMMNFMDPDILTRVCLGAGLQVEKAEFLARPDFPEQVRLDGREDAGVIARRA